MNINNNTNNRQIPPSAYPLNDQYRATSPSVHMAFSPPKRSNSPFRDLQNPNIKQINDQQRPLYTPAVLRVVKNNNLDSDCYFDPHRIPSNKKNLNNNNNNNTSSSSIRSTASSIVDYYWNYLTGNKSSSNTPIDYEGPSTDHWVPDSSRFTCSQCGRLFNYLTNKRRKHHCRSCGEIFCGDCLNNYIYLDNNAKFTLFGNSWDDKIITIDDNKFLCKVCHKCFQKYEEFVLDHTTRDHNLGTNGKDLNKSNNNDNNDNDRNNNDGSIPVDWDWSSF